MSINSRFHPINIMLRLDIANIDTDASYYLPYIQDRTGKIVYAGIANDAQTATNTCTVQLAIGSTDVTGGLITIPSGAAAGTVTTCTPTANNVITAGNSLKVTLGGSSTGSSRGHLVVVVQVEN